MGGASVGDLCPLLPLALCPDCGYPEMDQRVGSRSTNTDSRSLLGSPLRVRCPLIRGPGVHGAHESGGLGQGSAAPKSDRTIDAPEPHSTAHGAHSTAGPPLLAAGDSWRGAGPPRPHWLPPTRSVWTETGLGRETWTRGRCKGRGSGRRPRTCLLALRFQDHVLSLLLNFPLSVPLLFLPIRLGAVGGGLS